MTAIISADSLHRLVKQAIDSGAAATVAEAEALFQGSRLAIPFMPEDPSAPVEQATLLTAVALGRRVFLRGVRVVGALEVTAGPGSVGEESCRGSVGATG